MIIQKAHNERMYVYPIRQRINVPAFGQVEVNEKPVIPADFRLRRIVATPHPVDWLGGVFSNILIGVTNRKENMTWGQFFPNVNQQFFGVIPYQMLVPEVSIATPWLSQDYLKPYLVKKDSYFDMMVINNIANPVFVDISLIGSLVDEKRQDEEYSEPYFISMIIPALAAGQGANFTFTMPNYEILLESIAGIFTNFVNIPVELYFNIYDHQKETNFWEQDQNVRNICTTPFTNQNSYTQRPLVKNGVYTLSATNRDAAKPLPDVYYIVLRCRQWYK